MLDSRPVAAFFCLLLISAPGSAAAGDNPHRSLRTLVTAREAHSLSSQEASQAFPVHLHAIVTYYDPHIDPRHGALFVHDSTGSIFISVAPRPILPLHAGSLVDVVGLSGPGDYAPIVDHATVQVVGDSHVPRDAAAATMAQLLSGTMDGQWVEVEGVVHSVYLTDNDATLDIETSGGSIAATSGRESGVDYDVLVDSLVRIHGNAGPVFNRKRQMVGVHLFFPSLIEVSVLRPAPPDPFALPSVLIPDLLRFKPGLHLTHRVHVQGRVSLQWPGQLLCIQQARDGLCIQTAQDNTVSTGELVDAVGFPKISEYKPTLENAIYHLAGGYASALLGAPVTAEEAFRGDHDGQLVRIDGELIGQDHATGDLTLMMRSGKFLFPALLLKNRERPEALEVKDGSVLRLVGICSVQVDPDTTNQGEGAVRPGSIRILLRSIADIEVLKSPSWWTTQHTFAVLTGVVLLVFAAFGWIFILRRRVEHQTKALRRSEERLRHLSEHDVLTGLPNRFLLNDRLATALKRVERFGEGLALLMVDVDRFKQVNDSLGHQAGDQVLCELASRIRATVRQTDTVARLGGDEFVVLLPDLHECLQAEMIAAKIVAAISAPMDVGSTKVPISVSVGICTYPQGGRSLETLLQNVDIAMYWAKANGRDGFQVYRPGAFPSKQS
jgi:diguanylate cyclase (GGDEF)-like protein